MKYLRYVGFLLLYGAMLIIDIWLLVFAGSLIYYWVKQ